MKREAGKRPTPEEVEFVREVLVSRFRESGRDLPWRRTRDPWRVLVSEVMLQQIQVKRAVPFYERFLRSFPTVENLAEAPVAEAIKVWGDLGRYRRVVNLRRAARVICEEHSGEVPSDPEVLVKLPGVGPYTAGAVACFAYEKDVAFLDTNMRRVLHRLFFGPEASREAATQREVLDLARELVPAGGGWEWNQALMEFGALSCKARNPACEGCPLFRICRSGGKVKAAPPGRGRKTAPRYEESNRYYRGRVLAELRDAPPKSGVEIQALGARVRKDFADADVPWLYGVVESLKKDGLAVAEEKPAYGTGESQETRVRLP